MQSTIAHYNMFTKGDFCEQNFIQFGFPDSFGTDLTGSYDEVAKTLTTVVDFLSNDCGRLPLDRKTTGSGRFDPSTVLVGHSFFRSWRSYLTIPATSSDKPLPTEDSYTKIMNMRQNTKEPDAFEGSRLVSEEVKLE